MIEKAGFRIVPVDEKQIQHTLTAMKQYPLLNYGDLFSYALAKELDIPLLYKGKDFTVTDIRSSSK